MHGGGSTAMEKSPSGSTQVSPLGTSRPLLVNVPSPLNSYARNPASLSPALSGMFPVNLSSSSLRKAPLVESGPISERDTVISVQCAPQSHLVGSKEEVSPACPANQECTPDLGGGTEPLPVCSSGIGLTEERLQNISAEDGKKMTTNSKVLRWILPEPGAGGAGVEPPDTATGPPEA
eukprot:RCo047836